VLSNPPLLLFGLITLLFAAWIVVGLIRHHTGMLEERPKRKRWLLGVCEDFSRQVGIPLGILRLLLLLYGVLGIGVLFYLLYYCAMRRWQQVVPEPVVPPPPTVTRIESHHYPR